MDFKTFVRRPFRVQALQVTEANLAEVAETIGDGKIRRKDNGEPYFLADKRMIRSITRIELGYWVTKMDDHFRVYKPEVFEGLFWASDPTITQLIDLMSSHKEVVSDGV